MTTHDGPDGTNEPHMGESTPSVQKRSSFLGSMFERMKTSILGRLKSIKSLSSLTSNKREEEGKTGLVQ